MIVSPLTTVSLVVLHFSFCGCIISASACLSLVAACLVVRAKGPSIVSGRSRVCVPACVFPACVFLFSLLLFVSLSRVTFPGFDFDSASGVCV